MGARPVAIAFWSSSLSSHPQQVRRARPVVAAEALARLPRWPLWLLCLAYVLPGFVGRDPWTAEGVAFGVIWQLAGGHAAWLHPTLYGHPVGGGWLPYWLGAASVRLLGGWLGVVPAARLPFALLLGLSMAQTWYAAYQLARRDAALPVQPAFAPPIAARDYARAMADGALLSLVACLGLLARGHEIGSALLQLAGSSALLLAAAWVPLARWRAAAVGALGLATLAASGAPTLALVALLAGVALLPHRALAGARLPAGLALLLGATALGLVWHAGAQPPGGVDWRTLPHTLGIAAWFLWPAWPLALWALWRWRESHAEWHVLAPAALLALTLGDALLASSRGSVMLASLPPAALLAALALPVMRRVSLAALDWFALMFFSLFALVVWVLWLATLTGFPSQPAANVARLAPGYHAALRPVPTLLALLATLAWAAVVAWRAGRHRHPLWKGMVLSAGGVTLVWALVGTLWLPALDYASTYRSAGRRLAAVLRALPPGGVHSAGLSLAQQALLGYWSGAPLGAPASAPYLLQRASWRVPTDYRVLWRGQRPGESDDAVTLLERRARSEAALSPLGGRRAAPGAHP